MDVLAAMSTETPKPTFEQGLEKLEQIVKELEDGELSLENSLKLFEEGVRLSNNCRKQLQEAETKVEILLKKGGDRVPAPFEASQDTESPF